MKENIKTLCDLQVIDSKIIKAKNALEDLPQKLEKLEDKFRKTQESIKNINQRLEQNHQKQKKFELDITKNNEDINRYENQQLTVKTNKEYKALNSEITYRKEENAQIEESLIELMEAEMVLEEEAEKFEETLREDRRILEKEKEKIEMEMEKFEKKIEKLDKEKQNLSKEIPESLFKKYQLLLNHKEGKAIASIKNGVCSGCHLKIRPQIIVEISKQDSIITCENCSRILVLYKKSAKEN